MRRVARLLSINNFSNSSVVEPRDGMNAVGSGQQKNHGVTFQDQYIQLLCHPSLRS